MTNVRIGFIGLGNMGGRIGRCLVDAGRDVLGFDMKPENVAAAGATPATSLREVATNSDVIFLSLPDSKVVEAVTGGEEGLIALSRSGQIIVDLSTASPDSTRDIAQKFSERGATFLDAGISGGAAAAEKGALTLMVGGDLQALQSISEILDIIADQVFHIGESGAGHVTKLLNNFLNAIALSATAEVMLAAKKSGLALDTVLAVFNESSGINFATLNRFPKIIHGDYLKGGLTNTLMLKDVTLYVELLAKLGVPSLNSPGPVASFGLARSLGYADDISNTVVDALGDISGGIRLYEKS